MQSFKYKGYMCSRHSYSDFMKSVIWWNSCYFCIITDVYWRFWPPSATVVSAEPFLHGTGTLRCLQKEMATYRHWSVSLWRDPDDVSHCRILSPDKTEWRLISATLCGWRRCFVANQLWFMTCIREEVEEEGWQLLHKISTITLNYTNPNHNLHLMKPLNYTKSL